MAEPAATASIYENGSYLAAHPTWHAEDSPWKAAHIVRVLRRNNITPKSIAEIGCGAGGVISQVAKEMGTESAVGFEISPQAYELSKALVRPGLRFEKDDFFDGSDHFDVAMAIDVFEHVEDYLGFIRGMKGRATFSVFHIPLDVSVWTLLRSRHIRDARTSVGHLHFYTKDMALASLEHAGHKVIDWAYTQRLDDFRRTKESKLLHWPRRVTRAISEDFAATLFGGCSLIVLTS